MPESPHEDGVNETVVAEWKADTTPFDRVRSVMKRTYTPLSAPEIAEHAETTSTTARKHLRTLTENGFVDTVPTGGNTTRYKRSNESLVLEQAHDLLEETDRDTLTSRIAEMRGEIRDYREEFDADSPEDAAVHAENIDPEALREWQTTRRNLNIAKAALALGEAEDTVQMTEAL